MSEKTLFLSLEKKPFDIMVTGEKVFEFRKPTKWILSRLLDKKGRAKQYDHIKFVNGYGAERPYFVCEFERFFITRTEDRFKYPNGLKVEVEAGDVVIVLGKIIETGNLKP